MCRPCLVVLLLLVFSAPLQAAQHVNLIDALEALRNQGFVIVWSNDLVSGSASIDVERIDFDSVAAALPRLGLRFERSDDVWLVARADTAAPAQESGAAPAAGGSTAATTETVIVTGSRHYVPANVDGANEITTQDMQVTPALAGDAMRITNRLPGMSSVGISAKPLVRGGVDDETLILMDGVELLDPFHLADFQNIFSSIDDRTVESVDVYTGGFPARYGNRMSGVMDITMEPATPARTEIGVSVFSAFANTWGSSDDGATSWIASARRGNLEMLVDWLDRSLGSPNYDDVFARVGRRLGDYATLYLGVHTSRDNVSLTDNDEHATSDIDTTYWWARLDTRLSDAWSNSSVFSYVTSDRDRTEANGEQNVSLGFLDYSQEVRKYTLRSDFRYQLGELVMEVGGEVDYARSTYDSQALIDRGPVATLFGNPQTTAWDINVEPSGWSGGAYWSADIPLGGYFAVQPGLRWDFQDYYGGGAKAQLSPRLGLRFTPSAGLTARLALGRYYQPEGIHEMKAVDGVDHFYSAQHADHVVFGVEWEPSENIALRGETYYKYYERPRPRFENLFNTFVLVPQLEPDRVEIAPSHARVEGVDLQAQVSLSEALSAVVRGSWMNADDRIDGHWVPRKWSQRYTLQSMLVWQRDWWSASAALTWHSGWRTTALPPVVPTGTVLPLDSVLNHDTLSDYISFDVSLRRSWQVGRAKVTLFGDITNAWDHDNAVGTDYNWTETPAALLLTPDQEHLLPWVPSIGITVAF